MAAVGRGGGGTFLHYTDVKKFLKNLLWNPWSDFEIIWQECSLADPFQKIFDLSINLALVNWDFLHYMDVKEFLKDVYKIFFSKTDGQILK